MIWWAQITAAFAASVTLVMLLLSYRRQDAMQRMFLCGILLAVSALVLPDSMVFILEMWWGLTVVKASNLRTYIATIMAFATVALYVVLISHVRPQQSHPLPLIDNFTGIFSRSLCLSVMPMWMNIANTIAALMALIAGIAHIRHYSVANVRVQTRVLFVLPAALLAFLSCVFPTSSGDCLLSVLWLSSVYLTVLYVSTYGLPKMPTFSRNPHRRSFSVRSRRRR